MRLITFNKKRIMRKLFIGLTAAFALSASAQQPLRISAELEGTGEQVIVSAYSMTTKNFVFTDTLQVGGSDFSTKIDLAEPMRVMLTNLRIGRPAGRLSIYGVPGETCMLSGSWDKYSYDGSAFYKELGEIDNALENSPERQRLVALSAKCEEMAKSGVARDSIVSYFETNSAADQKAYAQRMMDFVKERPGSEAVATLLPALEPDQALKAYELLADGVKTGRMKSLIEPFVDQARAEVKRREAEKNVAPGKPAPDFTLNDINGKPLSLSDLRGKYVVLDFWGSWCGWCIKGFPQMKEYYAKYSSKMEILGIDCNDTDQKWKDAVAKYELPWKHVYHPKGGNVTSTYAVRGYPTKIVVDPEGKIAKVIVGEDPAFYTYLDTLLK